jgi:hypothetical protein
MLFIASGCGENETSETEDINISFQLKSLYLSGVAIDGYLSNANVEINGKFVKTDENGSWKISKELFSEEEFDNLIITISGGIDQSTGENFEGVIKVPLQDSEKTIIGTPITTIISAMINEDKNASVAYQDLSELINIPVETLLKDHLKMIEIGTLEEKVNGLKTLKTALVFQKSIEVISQAIDGGTDESFLNVTEAIGTIFNRDFVGKDNNLSYQSILKDPRAIAETMELDEVQKERVIATSSSITFLIEQIELIDDKNRFISDSIGDEELDHLSEIENEIKVADTIAIKMEEAIITNFDNPEELNASVDEFRDILAVLGGINGLGITLIDSNSSSKELYESVFTDSAIIERLNSINSLFSEFGIDNSKISEIVVGLSQISYSYENRDYSEEDIIKVKSIIENIIEREITYNELLKIISEMKDVQNMIVEGLPTS